MARKSFPKKLAEKKQKRRERRERNRHSKRKDNPDKWYEQTKKLAKKMGVRFLKDHETFKDIKKEKKRK